MKAWCLSDGSVGMAVQTRALALALGAEPVMKVARVDKKWDWIPTLFYRGIIRDFLPRMLSKDSDDFSLPWPDLVISCGRRAAAVAIGLRTRTGKDTRYIHIHSPQTSLKQFDLIVSMAHDSLTGPNVIKSRYALHAVTPETLATARNQFSERFASYASPRVAVLLGGTTNRYTLTPEAMAQMVMSLQRLLQATQCSLLITPSRRTGEANIAMLQSVFANNPRVYVYDGKSENPYMGMLALADAIVVTNDSVNMLTEAGATGKPLYVLAMPGHEHSKQARFADMLMRDNIARPFTGKLEQWDYRMENEMPRLAAEVREKLGLQ